MFVTASDQVDVNQTEKHLLDLSRQSFNIQEELNKIIQDEFSPHPFTQISVKHDLRELMSNFLAMSQAFPYIQAGSQKDLFFHCMDKSMDVPDHVEVSSVVGNFLVWDETGGLALTAGRGMSGLKELLKTKSYFHSNILKRDLLRIFGEPLEPHYSSATRTYLLGLYNGLSNFNPTIRCAHMIAFESHANLMLNSLWSSLGAILPSEKNNLIFFLMHVGGSDPAEAHHVEMTQQMISRMVPEDELQQFYQVFREAFQLNSAWCEELLKYEQQT